MNYQTKLSFAVNTCDPMELPRFEDTKKLTCAGSVQIKDVIGFAHGKVQFDKHIIYPSSQSFDPLDFIEITLPVISYKGDQPVEEFIALPQT